MIHLRLGRIPQPVPVLVEPPASRQAPPSEALPTHETPPEDAAQWPAPPGPRSGAGAPPHDDPAAFYVVQSGDTLSTIAQKLLGSATRAGELMRLNNLADADSIFIGQVLRLH